VRLRFSVKNGLQSDAAESFSECFYMNEPRVFMKILETWQFGLSFTVY
jgi:hypothetical protein